MTDAYYMGQQAAMRGDDILMNPYDDHDAQNEEWFFGFADWLIDNDCVMSA